MKLERGGHYLRSGEQKREEGPPDGRLGWSLSQVCHIPGSCFMSHRVKSCESVVRWATFTPYLEGLNGVYHQPSDGLKIQQPSTVKKSYFLLSTVKMHIKINSKKIQGISNFAISSADLQGILAPEESINWKN